MLNHKLLNSKYNRDILWNMASFALIALIGLSFNIIILKFYNHKAVGVFNQAYAIFIFLSQLAVGGFHLAVQYFIPLNKKDTQAQEDILSSSILLSVISSVLIVLIGYFLKDLPALLFKSEAVGKAFIWVVWGLSFFSINKVIISYFNGIRRMKTVAILQFLRFFCILVFLLILMVMQVDDAMLASCLAFGEALLFVICLSCLFFAKKKIRWRWNKSWISTNYHFGIRALVGNFLLDINTKVDVITLGIFLSDEKVGIYSFAASFFEGLLLIPVLLRNNINPILTHLSHKKNKALTIKILQKSKRSFYKIISGLSLLSIPGFYAMLLIFDIHENQLEYISIFTILNLGLALSSGYQPFLMIYNQFGQPKMQNHFVFWIFISNVVLNFALVPWLGNYGAAIGTSLAFVFQILLHKHFIKKLSIYPVTI